MKLGAKIFGFLSGLLILYLFVGFLLPGQWEARTEAVLSQTPSQVFPFLNRVDAWAEWNAMPESGSHRVGPESGPGAGLDWDDPQYGRGQFRILVAEPDSAVEYEVLIEGGSLRITGRLELFPEAEGTKVRWVERGDFGRNPLMGYAARGMGASQSEAMNANLDRLRWLLAEGSGEGR